MMKSAITIFATLLFCSSFVGAQTLPGRSSIRATGSASVAANPDQTRVTVSVETRATTAQESSGQNATATTNVLAALKQLLGTGADIRTVSYSVSAIYTTTSGVQTISGYQTTNSIEIRSSELTLVGKIIDTAIQAGATRISGITFTIKDPTTTQTQALRLAASLAKQQAEAIAAGLGVRTGNVLSAEQSSVTQPVNTDLRAVAAAASTPIETGAVTVSATVTVEVEIRP